MAYKEWYTLFKLCIHSIKKNSIYDHEIIVHVNEGIDGTLDYLAKTGIKYTYSKKNDGVCIAFNKASDLATREYLVLGHDDMYFCPNWDLEFKKELDKIDHKNFFLSGTMVQYFNGLIELDCGSNPQNFNENKIFEVKELEWKGYTINNKGEKIEEHMQMDWWGGKLVYKKYKPK